MSIKLFSNIYTRPQETKNVTGRNYVYEIAHRPTNLVVGTYIKNKTTASHSGSNDKLGRYV